MQTLLSTLMQLLFLFGQDTRFIEKSLIQTCLIQSLVNYHQLIINSRAILFSLDQDMRVEKTLIQTLAPQLSSTLMQLLFPFDQDMRVEETLIQTLVCQLPSTLMQLLFLFNQATRVEKTLLQTLMQLVGHGSWENFHTNSYLSTLIYSRLFSSDLAGNESWQNSQSCETYITHQLM